MKHKYVQRLGIFLAALLLLSGGVALFAPVWVTAAPDEGGRVPYRFSVDDLNGKGVGGTMIGVIRDMHLLLGQSLTAQGWLATAEGVSAYQYLWVPAGGGYAEWQAVEKAEISPRPDLAAAGIPYVSGHYSAGFQLTIDPPTGISEGLYDVYIRALDGMDTPCDMVALLGLRYGDPDVDDGKSCTISFPRIMREGAASIIGDASVTEDGIVLSSDGRVKLGEFNLAAFELLRITYTADAVTTGIGEGRRPILGLKSSGKHGYGTAGESYNMTDDLLYAAIRPTADNGATATLEIDLTEETYCGDIWLTGYLGGEVTVTEIELVYNGCATDRVAAKIYLSGDLVGSYFSSFNHSAAMGVSDPVLGDVLRLEVKEETNDPFVHFNAGKLLAEHEILLDADEYKYMVFLYRADIVNNSDRMNLYLCSGPITGATEACNQGVTLQMDGRWHYLLVDLSQKENWGGIINGWRFDYISANSDPGDGVEFATVQFFRTAEGARKAAEQDPAKQIPFKSGDPVLVRDMSEESQQTDEEVYTVNPEDAYVVTEAETEAATDPEPDSSDTALHTQPQGTEPPASSEAETKAPQRGCASALAPLTAALLFLLPIPLVMKKNTKEKYHEM